MTDYPQKGVIYHDLFNFWEISY